MTQSLLKIATPDQFADQYSRALHKNEPPWNRGPSKVLELLKVPDQSGNGGSEAQPTGTNFRASIGFTGSTGQFGNGVAGISRSHAFRIGLSEDGRGLTWVTTYSD